MNKNTQKNSNSSMNQNLVKMLPNEEHESQRLTGTLDDIVNKSKRIMD
uniref:Uncharacterized protein n=1 Tax=Meloidogyne enterolobii TaxID=390850 RepID=A0A6V7WS18_MELEN|nr:unnamed protein product [Meloidogyne enterolobii]